MTEWTPGLVEERLTEAALVLRQLPGQRRRGYFNVWPQIVHDCSDKVGREAKPMRAPPSPAAITRMEEALAWTIGLDPIDGRIVWMRAYGERWKTICWKVGLARAAANEHWLYALCVIAWRLNGKQHNPKISRRRVINQTRENLGVRSQA